jgi:2'-5' RNA ligase
VDLTVVARIPRLFAAVSLPDSLRRELHAVSSAIGRSLPDSLYRAVPRENLHLTLRFFGAETGAVDRRRIGTLLRERLERSSPGSLTLMASDLSAFGSLRRARVVWAGLRELGVAAGAPGRLSPLQREVEAVARDIGLAPETRPFVPHVTLGRLRSPFRLDAAALAEVRDSASDSVWSAAFAVTECGLFASFLSPAGAVYEPLERFSLEGAREQD